MSRFYRVYVVGLVCALGWALWTGWWLTPVEKVTSVPKSVRDNPGSYRSHYSHYRRYTGGK
jgi:hypothetical protein